MQASVQHQEVAQIVVLLAAIVIVTFWRSVAKGLVMLASTAIIATLGFGLIMIWQIAHHAAIQAVGLLIGVRGRCSRADRQASGLQTVNLGMVAKCAALWAGLVGLLHQLE